MDLDRSATDLLDDLTNRRVSAEAVMEATLARIEARNPAVNALVGLMSFDDALAQARAADRGPVVGPLHGLPFAVKDLMSVRGLRSTQGSPIFADHVPEHDDVMVAKLREAGAIIIGKTNTPEFGLGSHTFNPVYGRTTNPYDSRLTCGGSSGGAGVALALGMMQVADGSDMMGSLRNPAAWNNVYGFRPSWGRVPSEPRSDSTLHQMSTLGPMARSPEDIAILLDVLSYADPLKPDAAAKARLSPLQPRDLRGVRIGWLGDWSGTFPTDPEILAKSQEALAVLHEQGAQIEDLPAPVPFDPLWQSWTTLRSWQVGAGLMPLEDKAHLMKDSAQWELERAQSLTALEVHEASALREQWFLQAHALFETYDALVLPTTQVWPFDSDLPWPTEIAGVTMDTYHRWMSVMVPVSLIGLPCLSVPAGFGEAGLPTGIQIFGPRGSDARILEIGQAYHQLTQWPQRRPPPV